MNRQIREPSLRPYRYSYPVTVLGLDVGSVPWEREALAHRLSQGNVYYALFSPSQRETLLMRVGSLRPVVSFVMDALAKVLPHRKVVSVWVYGSYVYGLRNYQPDDIDVGVAVEGSAFTFRRFPLSGQPATPGPRSIDIFIYGEANLVRGVPVNDLVVAGATHRESVKRELSVAYWRNIVLLGLDFVKIPANLSNTYTSLMHTFHACYQRLSLGPGGRMEDEAVWMRKIANRLYELNAFVPLLSPDARFSLNTWKAVAQLPVMAQQGTLQLETLIAAYDRTLTMYEKIGRRFA